MNSDEIFGHNRAARPLQEECRPFATRQPPSAFSVRLETKLTIALCAVFGLGLVSAVRGEIFPFASWFLFSRVPQQVTAYELRAVEWNGAKFDPPSSVTAVPHLLRSPQSSTVRDLIQRIGRATEQKTDVAPALAVFRQHLHADGRGIFAVVRLKYDPLERWRTGQMEAQELARLPWRPAER